MKFKNEINFHKNGFQSMWNTAQRMKSTYSCALKDDISSMNIPVDMVFTYINGQDPANLHKRKQLEQFYNDDEIHSERTEGKNFDMLYNNVDEITFSVRSVVKYLPWIRTIFIVTDQQMPPVDQHLLESGRVRIVDHREILPEHYLPTFNSQVIESCIHGIRNLSEIFLYNNDDCLHFSPVTKDTFLKIMDDNRLLLNLYAYPSVIRFFIHAISELLPDRWPIANYHTRGISDSFSLLRSARCNFSWHDIITPKHMTMIIRKSTALRMEREFADILHLLRKQQFRMRGTFSYSTILYTMEKHWHPYDSVHSTLLFDPSHRFQMFDFNRYNKARKLEKLWSSVNGSTASFVCLNNIRKCQYGSFITVMKQKGLGDPVPDRSNDSYSPQQSRPVNV